MSLSTVFRAGEQGRFWYAVLGGSLEVRYHAADADGKVRINIICTTFICRSARWTPKGGSLLSVSIYCTPRNLNDNFKKKGNFWNN